MSDVILPVLIEIPKGSRNKYEYDAETGFMKLDRMLYSPVHYPVDYGFFLNTLGEDTDPLDAMVMVWEPTFSGCLIDVKPIGLFKMYDEKGIDDKILCVPVGDPDWNHLNSLDDAPPHLLKEIEHFFRIYKELEKKKTGVEGWYGRDEAIRIIGEAQERHKASGKTGIH